jgi:hypothetical protein
MASKKSKRSGKKSSFISSAIKALDDFESELSGSFVDNDDKNKAPKIKLKKDTIAQKLNNQRVWEEIRQLIVNSLIENYNDIEITNSPKYRKWKERALNEGYSVQVTNSDTSEVKYLEPSLRTGYLRSKIYDTKVTPKVINEQTVGANSIKFEIPIQDLFKNYGDYFQKRVIKEQGKDPFALTDEQLEFILGVILSNATR